MYIKASIDNLMNVLYEEICTMKNNLTMKNFLQELFEMKSSYIYLLFIVIHNLFYHRHNKTIPISYQVSLWREKNLLLERAVILTSLQFVLVPFAKRTSPAPNILSLTHALRGRPHDPVRQRCEQ